MQTLWQDLRYGARMLMKRPGFTLIAVVTLALGIGANTAIFSVVNGVLLRPLPYKEPDRLVMVWGSVRPRGLKRAWISPPNFFDFREQNQAFEKVSALLEWGPTLTEAGEPERLTGAQVSHDFFSVLGIEPILGRAFLAPEDRPNVERVVVLGAGLWQRRFGADPGVIGKKLTLDGNLYTVVGVMPAGFNFPDQAELWKPLRIGPTTVGRGSAMLRLIARLKPGVTLEQADADMNTVAGRLEKAYPEANTGRGVALVPLHEQVVGEVRQALLVLLGAVGQVLLIACANVANLLLARAKSREKEIAIRTALGARRGQIIRQLLTESLLLAIAGGGFGLLLAVNGADLLKSISPANIPRLENVAIDQRVLGFTLVSAVLTGVIFGIIPALQSSRPNLNQVLKEGSKGGAGGTSRGRVRSLLVVTEIALALMLMIGAGLLTKSFSRLLQVNPGYNSAQVMTAGISLPGRRYQTDQQVDAFYKQLLERLESVPGVQSAAIAVSRPLEPMDNFFGSLNFVGRPEPPSGEHLRVRMNTISPDYFRTLGTTLVKGRFFSERDDEAAPAVAIVNATFVRRYLPEENPLGKQITFGLQFDSRAPRPAEIVGVVDDMKRDGLRSEPEPEVFVAHHQASYPAMSLVIRTAVNPMSIVGAVRRELAAIDKDVPLYQVTTMDDLLTKAVGEPRFLMFLISGFATVALILAAVGGYGVTAYAVTERTREIGIRMALGAQVSDVFRLVVKQGMILALAGVGVGLAAAFALTRVMKGLLFGVNAADLPTFTLVALLLATVALLACWIPARRATKVDPLTALRSE